MNHAEMVARRAQVWATMQEIQSRSNLLVAEDRASWDAAEAELTNLSEAIERNEQAARLSAVAATPAGESHEPRSHSDVERHEAFGEWLRRGLTDMSPEHRALMMEQRVQEAGTPAAGGYMIPEGFWAKVTETMKAYGGILNVANVLTTNSGNDIPWPSNDDTGNVGALLAEGQPTTELALTIGTHTLKSYMFTSRLILASYQFLQDSAINPEQFISRKAGVRLGRALAAYLCTGTGNAQPTGITGAAGFATGKTGAAGQVTSVTWNDLIDLEHSVNAAYRNSGSCRYVLADSSVRVIRKLTDGDGRPLWQPSLTAGVPSTINGFPYTVDDGMPVMAASAKSIAFGDFNSGLVVRQVSGGTLKRLEERYAEYLQVGFFAFGRFDSAVDDAAAVRLYAHPGA